MSDFANLQIKYDALVEASRHLVSKELYEAALKEIESLKRLPVQGVQAKAEVGSVAAKRS